MHLRNGYGPGRADAQQIGGQVDLRTRDQEFIDLQLFLAALFALGGRLLVALRASFDVIEQLAQIVSGEIPFEGNFR